MGCELLEMASAIPLVNNAEKRVGIQTNGQLTMHRRLLHRLWAGLQLITWAACLSGCIATQPKSPAPSESAAAAAAISAAAAAGGGSADSSSWRLPRAGEKPPIFILPGGDEKGRVDYVDIESIRQFGAQLDAKLQKGGLFGATPAAAGRQMVDRYQETVDGFVRKTRYVIETVRREPIDEGLMRQLTLLRSWASSILVAYSAPLRSVESIYARQSVMPRTMPADVVEAFGPIRDRVNALDNLHVALLNIERDFAMGRREQRQQESVQREQARAAALERTYAKVLEDSARKCSLLGSSSSMGAPTEAQMCRALTEDFLFRARGADFSLRLNALMMGRAAGEITKPYEGHMLFELSGFRKHGECKHLQPRSANDPPSYLCRYSAKFEYQGELLATMQRLITPQGLNDVEGIFYRGASGSWSLKE